MINTDWTPNFYINSLINIKYDVLITDDNGERRIEFLHLTSFSLLSCLAILQIYAAETLLPLTGAAVHQGYIREY